MTKQNESTVLVISSVTSLPIMAILKIINNLLLIKRILDRLERLIERSAATLHISFS